MPTLAGLETHMDTQSLPQIVDAVNASHPDHNGPCGGIDSCPACQDLWRRLSGDRGTCVLCMQMHWPWEPHNADGGNHVER